MNIKFENNCYFDAAKQKEPVIGVKLKYKYGAVDRNSFNASYIAMNEEKNAAGRKKASIPQFLFAVAKTIYHTASLVFVGLHTLIGTRNSKPLKNSAFMVARTAEKAYGHFISLFNDKIGLYHIQNSQFQITCYTISMQNSYTGKESYDEQFEQLMKEKFDPNNYVPLSEHIEELFSEREVNSLKSDVIYVSFEPPSHKYNQRLFTKYIEIGRDDLALEFMEKKDKNYLGSNEARLRMAEKYFAQKEYDAALKVAGKLSSINDKSAFFLKLVSVYIENNDLQVAKNFIENNDSSFGYEDARIAYIKLAEKYFINKDIDEACKLFVSKIDIKNSISLVKKFVDYSCSQGDVSDALKLKEISGCLLSKETLAMIIRKCVEKNMIDEAMEAMISIYSDDDLECELYRLISLKLIDMENFERAFDCLYRMPDQTSKENLLLDLSLQFFNHPNFNPNTPKTILGIETLLRHVVSPLSESSFLIDLARNFLRRGNEEAARRVIAEIIFINSYRCIARNVCYKAAFSELFVEIKIAFDKSQSDAYAIIERFILGYFANYERKPKPEEKTYREVPQILRKVASISPLTPKNEYLQKLYNAFKDLDVNDYHRVFNLEKSFSKAQLNAASKKLLITIHPDKFSNGSIEDLKASNALAAFVNSVRYELNKIAT